MTDLHLPDEIEQLKQSDKVACFVCVKPSQSFSVVSVGKEGSVDQIHFVRDTDLLIDGGYFVLRKDIFQYIKEGEELVAEPFRRLMREDRLLGYQYNKFWYCMDTFKEQQELNDMFDAATLRGKSLEKRQSIIVNLCIQIEAVLEHLVVALVYGHLGIGGRAQEVKCCDK